MEQHDVTEAPSRAPRILELAHVLRGALAELYPQRSAADIARVAIRLAGKAQPRLRAWMEAAARAEAKCGPVGAERAASHADALECYQIADLKARHDALAAEVELLNEQLDEARRALAVATGRALEARGRNKRERARSATLAAMLSKELRS
ncbi:MAG TPA: hypothetical protein VF158_14420 [Longimicrobiales bacterium]